MKLRYKILWIEDQKKTVHKKAKNTRNFLQDKYGFECDDKDIEILNYDEFKEKYIDNDKLKLDSDIESFDLLLVDFDLGEEGKAGDELIEIIRKGLYSEILFYSSNLPALKNSLQSRDIDGVFTTNRAELEYKIKKLIQVTIKKVQDVNNLRGLIMAEVAELDRIKERIISKFNNEADDSFKKYIKNDVFSKIKEELENLKCIVSVHDSECCHSEINLEEIQKNFFYDTFKKSRTIYKIKRKKCNTIDFVHDEYKEKIIDKRNVLAHQEEETRIDGVKILKYPNYHKKDDLEFTEEHCIQIRKDIKKYKTLLETIEDNL